MTGEGREGEEGEEVRDDRRGEGGRGMCDTATSCRYNEDLELEDAVHTAILTLKVSETPSSPSPLPFSLFSILFFSSLPPHADSE